MPRIWSEPYSSKRHAAPMPAHLGGGAARARHHRSSTLFPHRVVLVNVCSFTFVFHSAEEIRACLDYYSRKVHPSSRSAAAAWAVARGEVTWRWEVERWYERLPLYLRKETKRSRVIIALQRALFEMSSHRSSNLMLDRSRGGGTAALGKG